MLDPAQKSFEIRTARQYLDELVRPSHADFLKDTLSSRKAVTCALFAWHLRDWVWAQKKAELRTSLGVKNLRAFDSYLFENCPELLVIQELATGSKHFRSDSSDVKTTELAHGFASGLGLLFTQSHLIVKTPTTVHFAQHLFDKVISYWESLFEQIASHEQSSGSASD